MANRLTVLFFSVLLSSVFDLSTPIHAATATAALDRSTIMVGETATLTISVEGGTPQSAESFPPVPGLSIQYRGSSRSTVILNTQQTDTFNLNFAVTASQPGQFTIPATRVTVNGNSIPTQPVTLTVTKNEFSNDNPLNRYAFLRLVSSKQEAYVGEVFPIEVQLYVTAADNPQFPQLQSDGFVIHKQAEMARSKTQLGNTIYNVLPFGMSVSPAKAGKLTLGPAEMTLTLHLRAQSDPNDIFGMLGRFQRRQVQIASPPLEINVLPLPRDNVPPEFTGAIGTFHWNVSASPESVSVGEPITLRMTISGNGNLDNLKLPNFNWNNFKIYQANSSISSQDPLGIQGTKTFEQVVVPQSAAVQEIPAFSMAYFDPGQKIYQKLTQAALPISVAPAAGGQALPTVLAARGEDEPPAERTDIVHIKLEPGPIMAVTPPLVRQPWFLALQAVPLLVLAALTFWRKRQDHLANNPKIRRKAEVHRIVRSGLRELRAQAESNESDAFFAQVFRLLQEQLGERLDLPASAITEAVLDERLPRRGASPDLIERLHQLFQICNQARYAPVRTHQELLAVADKLETALAELQQLPD